MSARLHLLPLAAALLFAACAGGDAQPAEGPSPPTPAGAPSPGASPFEPEKPLIPSNWTGAKADGWTEVAALEKDQKYEAASERVEALLAEARAGLDRAPAASEEYVRALVKRVQLRVALHGYETAVRQLAEATWPTDLLGHTTLRLFFAQSLRTYARAYSWEIRQRETLISGETVDLKRWTWAQIHAHAHMQYREAWRHRAALGDHPVSALAEHLTPNDFPRGIRGTLRDTATYLWVELLADSSGWRPEQQSRVRDLDLAALMSDAVPLPALEAPETHPLQILAAVLADLEGWHAAAGRAEAALEARRVRLEHLHAAFTHAEDRRRVRDSLRARLDTARDLPWWAMGAHTLAQFTMAEGGPDALIDARALAAAAAKAWPDALGGKKCAALVSSIEQPSFDLTSMAHDRAGARSLGVRHKNLETLHFRAWRYDLAAYVRGQQDRRLLPDQADLRRMLDEDAPTATWTVSLPPTPDHRVHQTWVVPPMTEKGGYVIAASPDPAFDRAEAPVRATLLTLSDLVVLHRQPLDALEAEVLEGADGAPIAGATVTLFRYDWRRGHQQVDARATDAEGRVRFTGGARASHFLLVQRGADLALSQSGVVFGRAAEERSRQEALIYTDRSVYRPGHTVHWQVVGWRGRPQAEQLEIAPDAEITVELRDGNNEVVAQEVTRTNAHGSAAGEFVVPAGRALGRWSLRTDWGNRGGQIRVEEYKRPTFEAELEPAEGQIRLNEPATLRGEARYYFGLPVTAGEARWRVVRTPNYPWWWGAWWGGPSAAGQEVVATGASRLDAEGGFGITFTPEADPRLAEGKARAVTYSYAVFVDVTDEGGETRSTQRSFRLGFVAVQASLALDAGFLRAGVDAAATITRTNLDGAPQPGEGAWTLSRLATPETVATPADLPLPGEGRPHATPGDRQRARWSLGYNPRMALAQLADADEVAQGTTRHGADGKARVPLVGLAPGAYRLRYRTQDAFGAEYTDEQVLVVAGPQTTIGVPVDLQIEQSKVSVGGTLRILAHSGTPGQRLSLDIWRRGQRVSHHALVAGQDPPVIEIPITAAHRGGLGVTLQYVRDHQLVRLQRSVTVPRADKLMKVSFSTFRDTLRPGQKETWTVRVEAPEAKRAATEVLAYMYDKSLDVFAPHAPPSPLSLLPWQGGVGGLWSNLQAAQRIYVQSASFPTERPPGDPRPDRLDSLSGYGVGGPGGGSFGAPRMRLAAPAPAAPAPPPDEAPTDSDDGISGEESLEESRAPEASPTGVRSNFAETAFFQPQLRLGPDGAVDISFEVPDSVTAWNVWVHAISKDLSYGSAHEEVRTVKELMVRPYLPRFLREGDLAHLEVVINNAGEAPLAGQLDLDIIDPATERSVLADFGLDAKAVRGLAFSAAAGKSDKKRFTVKAPSTLGQVAVKVTARAGYFGDGELRPLPVLPGRVHLAQSRFTTLKGPETKALRFADLAKDDDATRINERLVVTLDGQLFYGVLAALPYLVNYPYECTEQTLNRFLSTGILSSLYGDYPAIARMAKALSARETRLEAWDAPDPNRAMTLEETPWLRQAKGGGTEDLEKVLDPRIAGAQRHASLTRLKKAQTQIGGFPWWPGGPPSPYMTLYVLHGFAKALEFEVEVPKPEIQRAWGYLKRHTMDELLKDAIARGCCWEFVTSVNYVLSRYPDDSWSGGVFSAADRQAMLDFSFKHWREHSPMLKGYLAMTLARADRAADARVVWESVLDSAKQAPDQGTFWAAEDRSWLWYNDTIETHAFALRVTMELEPEWSKLDGLVLWLFLNKKLNHWKSTKATAEVIYSLAHYLKAKGQLGGREETRVQIGAREQTFVFEPDEFTGKKNQIVVAGSDIVPADATITLEAKSKGFQLASATWHFSTERMPAAAHGDFLEVHRTYYRRDSGGSEITLVPLAEGAPVKVGDEVEVHLSLKSTHALEYVHLRDPRGAGFEPVSLRSEHKYDLGVRWFEEVRDSATNFFFERLPHGEYTFRYRLRATTAGAFKVGPATVQPMYAPEFTAYSAGHTLAIGAAQ